MASQKNVFSAFFSVERSQKDDSKRAFAGMTSIVVPGGVEETSNDFDRKLVSLFISTKFNGEHSALGGCTGPP